MYALTAPPEVRQRAHWHGAGGGGGERGPESLGVARWLARSLVEFGVDPVVLMP